MASGAYICLALIILCLMQPTSGETFLTITNAQWWLALSLALICSIPDKFRDNNFLIILGLSLTGPFCILFFPVALFQALRLRVFDVLIPVAMGTAIQVICLLQGGRSSQSLDPDIQHWLQNLYIFFCFGASSVLVVVASIFFWICAVFLIVKGSWEYRCLLVCAFIAYVAAMVSLWNMPAGVTPLGNGSRYFTIPYSLFVIGLLLTFSRFKKTSFVAFILLAIIFISTPHSLYRESLGFSAYAKLSSYQAHTSIPLAPSISSDQGFTFQVKASPLYVEFHDLIRTELGDLITSERVCSNKGSIAVVIDADVKAAGAAILEWKEDESIKRIKRYYPAGRQSMQLAFLKNDAPVALLFKRVELPFAKIYSARYLCM